jgi:hypothetical protein
MASSVGAKSWISISPAGSETGIVYDLTHPTSGYGPEAIGNVYLDLSALYSSYVTWSARSRGAVFGVSKLLSQKRTENTTLVFGINFRELRIHAVNDRRMESIYKRFNFSHAEQKWGCFLGVFLKKYRKSLVFQILDKK